MFLPKYLIRIRLKKNSSQRNSSNWNEGCRKKIEILFMENCVTRCFDFPLVLTPPAVGYGEREFMCNFHNQFNQVKDIIYIDENVCRNNDQLRQTPPTILCSISIGINVGAVTFNIIEFLFVFTFISLSHAAYTKPSRIRSAIGTYTWFASRLPTTESRE